MNQDGDTQNRLRIAILNSLAIVVAG